MHTALESRLTDMIGDAGGFTLAVPGTTEVQHAMHSTVALWSEGFQETFNDAVLGLESAQRRCSKNPLGKHLFAAEETNKLVVSESIPFRAAYRQVAAGLNDDGSADQ